MISRILAISFIVVVGFAGIEATYGLWTQARFGWGPRQIGLAFMVIGLLGAFCQGYLSGRLVRRYGEPRTLTGGLVFMGLGLVTQGLSPIWPVAMLGLRAGLHRPVDLLPEPDRPDLAGRPARPAGRDAGPQHERHGARPDRRAGVRGQLFSLVAPGAPFAVAALLILPGLWFAGQVRKRVPLVA